MPDDSAMSADTLSPPKSRASDKSTTTGESYELEPISGDSVGLVEPLSAPPGPDDGEETYPTGLRLALIVGAMFASVFIVAISQTVLASAIPSITDAFRASDDIIWYSSVENIAALSLQLPFGRAYSLINNKWVYATSLGIYLAGTAICGASGSSIALILGRAVQGIGCAGVFGGSFILIAHIAPLHKRSVLAGLFGAAYAIASVLGPLIGGVVTKQISWRWCFYFVLPIGSLAELLIILAIPTCTVKSSDKSQPQGWVHCALSFDPLGTSLILSSLVCLLLALQWGGTIYPWSDARVVGVLTVFSVTMTAWLGLQSWQGDDATVPFGIAAQRSVATSNLYLLFLNASFGIFVVFLPIWFQSMYGDDAEQSGIKLLALCISTALGSIFAGVLAMLIGYYTPFVVLSPFLASAGSAMLLNIGPQTRLGILVGAQILHGSGVGMGSEQTNVAVQTVLPKDKIAKGTSLTLFTRLLGFAVGVSTAQNVFRRTMERAIGKELAQTLLREGMVSIREKLEMRIPDDPSALTETLNGVNHSLTRVFLVALVAAAISAPFACGLEWKSIAKEKQNEKPTQDN